MGNLHITNTKYNKWIRKRSCNCWNKIKKRWFWWKRRKRWKRRCNTSTKNWRWLLVCIYRQWCYLDETRQGHWWRRAKWQRRCWWRRWKRWCRYYWKSIKRYKHRPCRYSWYLRNSWTCRPYSWNCMAHSHHRSAHESRKIWWWTSYLLSRWTGR